MTKMHLDGYKLISNVRGMQISPVPVYFEALGVWVVEMLDPNF